MQHSDRLRQPVSKLTYAELASRYEVDLCTGGCGNPGHEDGWFGGRMVHFRDRGVTRSGLRKFLMLVHDARFRRRENVTDLRPASVRSAHWIHNRNVFAYRTAFHDLGIRLDRRLSAADRAKVRHLMQGHDRPELKSLRNWARAS